MSGDLLGWAHCEARTALFSKSFDRGAARNQPKLKDTDNIDHKLNGNKSKLSFFRFSIDLSIVSF